MAAKTLSLTAIGGDFAQLAESFFPFRCATRLSIIRWQKTS